MGVGQIGISINNQGVFCAILSMSKLALILLKFRVQVKKICVNGYLSETFRK
jgi:hypothetical protein